MGSRALAEKSRPPKVGHLFGRSAARHPPDRPAADVPRAVSAEKMPPLPPTPLPKPLPRPRRCRHSRRPPPRPHTPPPPPPPPAIGNGVREASPPPAPALPAAPGPAGRSPILARKSNDLKSAPRPLPPRVKSPSVDHRHPILTSILFLPHLSCTSRPLRQSIGTQQVSRETSAPNRYFLWPAFLGLAYICGQLNCLSPFLPTPIPGLTLNSPKFASGKRSVPGRAFSPMRTCDSAAPPIFIARLLSTT